MEGEGLLSWSGRGEVTADRALCWPPLPLPSGPRGSLGALREHTARVRGRQSG